MAQNERQIAPTEVLIEEINAGSMKKRRAPSAAMSLTTFREQKFRKTPRALPCNSGIQSTPHAYSDPYFLTLPRQSLMDTVVARNRISSETSKLPLCPEPSNTPHPP